jgi:hypothetical protein
MRSGRLPLLAAALVASVAALTQARAAPLDAEACAKLQTEHTDLERGGIEKDMEKGPEWAKANLGLDKMQRVQRFIELEELLMFRCRTRAIVHLTPEREWSTDQDNDDKDDNDDNDNKEAEPKADKPAQAKAADPHLKDDTGKKAVPSKKQAPVANPGKAAAGQPAEAGVTSIEKRPPKAKVDDAFRSPPPDPTVDPFATQVNPR